MNDMEKDYKGTLIREVQPRDVPALKQLWVDVFGDPASLVDRFLALLPEMGCVSGAGVSSAMVSSLSGAPQPASRSSTQNSGQWP